MRYVHRRLDVPGEDGIGQPTRVADLDNLTLQVVGAFDATLTVDVSLDGTNYSQIDSVTITTQKVLPLNIAASHVRVTVADYVSGAPIAIVGGLDRT